MSNNMRWRYGDTNPVVLPVDSATVIEIGDLVYSDSGEAKPAGSHADEGSLAGNQELFHDNFAGVAMQASRVGDTAAIRVATAGVFELRCGSATFEVGDLVGADENAAGDALENQQIIGVATENLAVGRVASRVDPAATKVLVDVVSTLLRGGPQVAA